MTKGTAARGTDSRTRPDRLARLRRDLGERGERLSQRRARALHEPPPGIRQRHAARGAGEQHDAQLLLELPHRLAHRGARDAELARGAAEAAQPGDGEEDLELREGRPVHALYLITGADPIVQDSLTAHLGGPI